MSIATPDISALQLEARFSFGPNSLGYCGRDTATQKFLNCICQGKCNGVEEEVSKFIVLYPYLKTISLITQLPIFSHQVIESYWLGNDILEAVKPHHYGLLLEQFAQQGVPEWLIKELRGKPPKVFIPTHLFQVLYVGVGRASGAVPFSLESINHCMIRWGRVMEVAPDHIVARLHSLQKHEGKYTLRVVRETIPFTQTKITDPKVGESIAVHWNVIAKVLTAQEEKQLAHWTKRVCAAGSADNSPAFR